MDNFTWPDIIKLLVPIITVFIAGLMAIQRMRSNIKLEAKLKWKEEFRNRVLEFLHTATTLEKTMIDNFIFNKDNIEKEVYNKEASLTRELHTKFYAIDFMIAEDHPSKEILILEYRQFVDNIFDILGTKEKNNFDDLRGANEFYMIAKEIYDRY